MREVIVASPKSCDFCGSVAAYDAPTHGGPWANMCEKCYRENGVGTLGSKLVVRKGIKVSEEDKKKKNKIVMPTEKDMESACFDGLWYPKCPYCGCENACEPDGDSVWCSECEEKYQVGTCC